MARKLTAKQLLSKHIINSQESIVLAELRRGASTNRRLAFVTDLPINCITPRVYALRKKGLVALKTKELDIFTNRTVSVWAA